VSAGQLLWLFGQFMVLSLLSMGGALVVLPDVHRLMVVQARLLTDVQFNASIAIAQSAPGPNCLFAAVMGFQAGGLPGAAATLVGLLAPSSVLAVAAARWAHARRNSIGLQAFRAGMAPLSVALMVAAGWILTFQTPGWTRPLAAAVAALLVWRTRIHLLWLMAAGAALGVLGWI
jgi:chromate transporter